MFAPLASVLIDTPWIAVAGWCAWAAAIIETLRPAWSGERPTAAADGRWRGLVILAVAGLRWSFWVEPWEHSVDEGQGLAGAITLWTDPVFWRSVDGATAGPLHYYLLMPAALFDGQWAYFTARLIGQALVIGAFFLTGRILGRVAHPMVERAAVLVAVSAYAFSRTLDHHHTSTEVLPVFLLAFAAERLTRPARSRATLWAAGLALGCVPWAKLQAAPIALGFGLVGLLVEWRARRSASALALVSSALIPTLLVAAGLTLHGGWADMLTLYLRKNTTYSAESAYPVPEWAWSGFLGSLLDDGVAGLWVAGGCILILSTLASPVGAPPALRTTARVACGWLLLAAYCVAMARRPFFHYWYLVTAPWLLTVGIALERARLSWPPSDRGRARAGSAVLLALLLAPLALHRVAGPWRDAETHRMLRTWQAQNQELAALVRPHVKPSDRLAVWGWRNGIYVELGLAQGTRQAHSEAQLRETPWQPQLLRMYWEDFQQNRPAVFADAVGPGNFGFLDRKRAHESFRVLAEAVRRDYTLLVDRHGVRLYLRNDRLGTRRP